MDDQTLLNVFRAAPASLDADEYLRAMQLATLLVDDSLAVVADGAEVRRILKSSCEELYEEDLHRIAESYSLFSASNLIQSMADDMQTHAVGLGAILPSRICGGFLPTLFDSVAATIWTPRGDPLIVVDLGIQALISTFAAAVSPILVPGAASDVPLPPRDRARLANAALMILSRGHLGSLETMPFSTERSEAELGRAAVADAICKSILRFIVSHEVAHAAMRSGLDREAVRAMTQYVLIDSVLTAQGERSPRLSPEFGRDLLAALRAQGTRTEPIELGLAPGELTVSRLARSRDVEYLADFFATEMLWRKHRRFFAEETMPVESYFDLIAPDLALSFLDLIDTTRALLVPLQDAEPKAGTHPSFQDRKTAWRDAPACSIGGEMSYWMRLGGGPRRQCAAFARAIGEVHELIRPLLTAHIPCPRCALRLAWRSISPEAWERWQREPQGVSKAFACGGCGFYLVSVTYCTACELLTLNAWDENAGRDLPFCGKCFQSNSVQDVQRLPALLEVLEGRRLA